MNPLRVVVEKYSAAFLGGVFLLLLWGGVEVDDVPPHCLGAGLLLGGSGGGLALLGLHHRGWRLVLVPFVGRVVGVACVVRVRQ